MLQVGDAQRRARIARRHGIAPEHRHADVGTAAAAMTALHATEAPTVHLALAARVEGITPEDVDRALYDERVLVKQLAMRRTLFVFPRDLLPAVWGSASARVATAERKRLAKEVQQGGLADDGEAWVDAARAAVLDRLEGGELLTTQQLREDVPEIAGTLEVGVGRTWGGTFPVGPRVVTLLGAEGRIVRGTNAGHWRSNRPRWTLMETWLGEVPPAHDEQEGYAELVRHWLWTFGPGTEADLVWWLGGTKRAVRAALADLAAVEVALESGGTGWLLPDDLDPVPEVEPWPALLPVLDPTLMGWRDRDWYLPPEHVPYLFDSNGNGGTTAWWNGRVVGCWVQEDGGTVRVVLREDVGAEAAAALAAEAERLTAWLDGEVVPTVYASLQMKQARLP